MAEVPVPFKVKVSAEEIEDLKRRLASARWPEQLEDAGWDYGTEKTYLKLLADYWQTTFSWKDQEALLNRYKQFTLPVHGINMHFVHERSSNPDAIPLVFIHGWPGSFFEVYKILPLLLAAGKNGGPDFHVVAPSLPGFGFSSAPRTKGYGAVEMGKAINELMVKLGYTKYVAQGGDWGALLVKVLALNHPDSCKAIHSNLVFARPQLWNLRHVGLLLNTFVPGLNQFPIFASREDMQSLRDVQDFTDNGTGYQQIQGTKPQTLGYGMTDSPLGILAWILEKFRDWSDCGGDVESVYTKDEILTNVSIYWFSKNITSSFRIYYETRHVDFNSGILQAYCKVPSGFAIFPKEIYRAPRTLADSLFNVKHWSDFKKGGHFAALEQPEALAADMITFFGKWH